MSAVITFISTGTDSASQIIGATQPSASYVSMVMQQGEPNTLSWSVVVSKCDLEVIRGALEAFSNVAELEHREVGVSLSGAT